MADQDESVDRLEIPDPGSPETFEDRRGNRVSIPRSQIESGKRVHVVDPETGSLNNVPANQLDQALTQGFELADEELVEKARIADSTSSFEAFVEGAGEQAVPLPVQLMELGGNGPMAQLRQEMAERLRGDVGEERAEELLAEDARRRGLRQEVLDEEHGTAQTLGSLAGLGVTAGAGGGASSGGRLAARVLAREGAESVGRRLVRQGVQEAVEGAVFEGKRVLSEDDLGEQTVTGERLAAAVGIGTVAGFGGAALLSGTGTLLRRGAGGAVKRTRSGLRRMWGETRGAPLTRKAEDALVGILEKTGRPEAAGAARRALSDTAEGRRAMDLIRRGDSALEDSIPSIRRSIDEMGAGNDTASAFARGKMKRANVLRGVRELDDDAVSEARVLVDEIRGLADEVDESPISFVGAPPSKRLRQLADEAQDAVERGASKGGRDGMADIYMSLDTTKRAIGKMRKQARRSEFAKGRFDDLYEQYRTSLEKPDVWGSGAASAQKEVNQQWAQLIAMSEQVDSRFLSKSGTRDGFDEVFQADPAKIQTQLKALGRGGNSMAEEQFDAWTNLQRRFQETVEKHYDLPADARKTLGRSRMATEKLQKEVAEIRDALLTRNQLEDAATSFELSGIGSTVGATAGGFMGGGLGAAAGSAAGSALARGVGSPTKAVQTLAVIKDLTAKMRRHTDDRARAWVERVTRKKPRISKPDAPMGRKKLTPAFVTPATLEVFEDKVDSILEVTRNPSSSSDSSMDRLGGIAEAAPKTAAHATATAGRAAAFLRDKIPPSAMRRRSALTPHLKKRATVPTQEVARFLRYLRAVEDPTTVLDDLADGTLTLEGVEAMRAVYPRMYESVVSSVYEQLSEAEEPVPYDARVRLGILLGIPTDPSLEPRFVARMQESFSRPPEQEQSPSIEAPDIGGSMLSGTQRLRQREPA